jgi:hypothetical protein
MEQERFKEILEIGETIRVEFKRCGNTALKAIPMKRYALFSTVLAVIYF